MITQPLFRALPQQADAKKHEVDIWFNNTPFKVAAGISVAAALLSMGVTAFRTTPVKGMSRAPYCMMGVCFECLVEVDGRPSCQGCMVTVSEGMRIRSQHGARDLVSQGEQ